MVRRIAPFGVVSLVVLAACGAMCQNVVQCLPDTPSVQSEAPAPSFDVFVEKASSTPKYGANGTHAPLIRPLEFAPSERAVSGQKDSRTVLSKYLSPSLPKQQSSGTLSDGSFMARATHAASRILFTRDDAGKDRLNTSYFLRALTSVAADTASRPYWRRSVGEPFSDFGSTVGNDAGRNLLREFEPGLQHLMKSHAPKFVARIAERIGHN